MRKNGPYPFFEYPDYHLISEMLADTALAFADQIAFTFHDHGQFIQKNYGALWSDIQWLGSFLKDQKISKGAHIAIVGENSYAWLVCFMTLLCSGMVAVPIDKDLPAEKIAELMGKADCQAAFVNDKMADAQKLPASMISWKLKDVSAMLLPAGRKDALTDPMAFQCNEEDLAALFFTSGTTGAFKAVMLSQKNIMQNVLNACALYKREGNSVAVLPFHHSFGLITIFFDILCQCPVHINNGLKYIMKDLTEQHPRHLYLVPLFVQTFYKQIISTARKNGMERKLLWGIRLSNWLLQCGIDVRKRLFGQVHEAFGGELRTIICGGAALDPFYVKQFRAMGIEISNGYGITESSPVVSVNRQGYYRDGSVGQPLKGCEVRILPDHEISIRSTCVSLGYYRDESATRMVFHDGWFDTGDLGYMDSNGFLHITGRKKNLIILSNGENVSPEQAEDELKHHIPGIHEIVVFAQGEAIAAAIFPDEDHRDDQAYFDAAIKEYNKNLPTNRRIAKCFVRDREFSKNSSQKILRNVVMEEYNHA